MFFYLMSVTAWKTCPSWYTWILRGALSFLSRSQNKKFIFFFMLSFSHPLWSKDLICTNVCYVFNRFVRRGFSECSIESLPQEKRKKINLSRRSKYYMKNLLPDTSGIRVDGALTHSCKWCLEFHVYRTQSGVKTKKELKTCMTRFLSAMNCATVLNDAKHHFCFKSGQNFQNGASWELAAPYIRQNALHVVMYQRQKLSLDADRTPISSQV